MKRRGYYIISPHGEARANILENDNLHIQVEFSAKLSQELYLKKANIILQKIDKRQRTAVTDVRMVGGKHAAIDLVRVWRIVGVGILEAAWIVDVSCLGESSSEVEPHWWTSKSGGKCQPQGGSVMV